MTKVNKICVVHLVRACNGIEPFKSFWESYKTHPGGIEHDLLIVFKGFENSEDTSVYRQVLGAVTYSTIEISDKGFDITAYYSAANAFSQKYSHFCFLNSYSVILDKDWLKKLFDNLSKPGVGLVGATGSWNSHRTSAFAWFRRSLNYSRVLLPGEKAEKMLANVGGGAEVMSMAERLKYAIQQVWLHFRCILYFDPFPSYHIRTNAFMISSEDMNNTSCPVMNNKMAAYKFESGPKSLTNQVLGIGKDVLVVGQDGIGYSKEKWPESKTFWISEQENLLVADNQTRDYANADSVEKRNLFSYLAWKIPEKIDFRVLDNTN